MKDDIYCIDTEIVNSPHDPHTGIIMFMYARDLKTGDNIMLVERFIPVIENLIRVNGSRFIGNDIESICLYRLMKILRIKPDLEFFYVDKLNGEEREQKYQEKYKTSYEGYKQNTGKIYMKLKDGEEVTEEDYELIRNKLIVDLAIQERSFKKLKEKDIEWIKVNDEEIERISEEKEWLINYGEDRKLADRLRYFPYKISLNLCELFYQTKPEEESITFIRGKVKK